MSEAGSEEVGRRRERASEAGSEEVGRRRERVSEAGSEEVGRRTERASEAGSEEVGRRTERASEAGSEEVARRTERASEAGREEVGRRRERASEAGSEEVARRTERASEAGSEEVGRAGRVRKSKRNFEHKLAQNIKSDSKSFYACVRSKQIVRDKVGPLEDNFGNIVTQGFLMAEELNMQFSSVFTREDTTVIVRYLYQKQSSRDRRGKRWGS